jgi:hypothetical protein
MQVNGSYPDARQGKTKIIHLLSCYGRFESFSGLESTDLFIDQLIMYVDLQERDSAPDLHSL